MYFSRTIAIIMLMIFITAGCSQTPSRYTEIHLSLPQSVPKQQPFPEKIIQDEAEQPSREWVPASLWDRMRTGFRLSGDTAPAGLPNSQGWYNERQYHMDRVVELSAPYLYFVLKEVEKRGMPSEIALLPVVESSYQPFAHSHRDAAGIWQFIPSTGKHYGLKQNEWYDGRRDIHASTHAALDFLQDLYKRLDNDWLLALAAYNSGGATVERAVRTARKNGKSGDFWSIRPLLPRETRHYVPKLLAISAIVMDPESYGISLKEIPNEPFLTHLRLDTRVSLKVAAKLAGLSIDEFRRLNPAFNRQITPPGGTYNLMLPVGKATSFKWQLSRLSPDERIGRIYHTVIAGENLTVIARKYGTTPTALRKDNRLSGDLIRVGDRLQVLVTDNPGRNASSNNEKITHTVTNGDTLWSLARRYRVTIAQLARWNAIPAEKPLMPGQKLIIHPESST